MLRKADAKAYVDIGADAEAPEDEDVPSDNVLEKDSN
jgi:hypothetical protein